MKKQILFSLLVLIVSCKNQQVGSDIWKNSSVALSTSDNTPENFAQYNLQEESFYSTLRESGTTEKRSVRISIPDPDGKFHEFIVWKSIVANRALVEKYPNLQTFQGIDVNTDAVRIRIENSDDGIQAIVFGGENTWYITPVAEVSDNYLVYYKKDIPAGAKSFWSDKVIQEK
ncbi:MAG: hypothetical protein WBA74_21180 [Cyclobacteriaceae bacterium]